MKFRVVNSTEVCKGMRFDGSYHNAESNVYDYVISSHSEHNLDFYCSEIFTSGRNKRAYTTEDHGVPFLSNSDASALNPFATCKYSSRKFGYDKSALLRGGMILTGRVGAIGQTTFVPSYWERYETMGSDNIIRIVVKPEYKNGFIYAYLASKMGNLSFWKHATGGVQPFITDRMVGNLPIPNFPESFQTEIDDLIQESARLREEATEALEEAVSLFEKEIGQSTLSLGYQCGSVSSSAISDKFVRFDSQYQLGNQKLKKEKTTLATDKISAFAKNIFIGNRDKRNYVNNGGIPFLSSSDMMLANPKRSCKQLSKRASNLSTLLVSRGTILISRSGTVGNTIIIGDTIDGCAVSEHAMRLVIDEDKISPEYVFAYFKTKQGQNSLKVLPYGSVIVTLGEDFLGNVDLPILARDKQNVITELVKTYINKSDKAVTNENLAISKVEQEIERWNKQ